MASGKERSALDQLNISGSYAVFTVGSDALTYRSYR
jgi:hypothetical protein